MTTIREAVAKKNFRYNRYLMLRYVLAAFFFTNLYWLLSLFLSASEWFLLPLSLIVVCLWAMIEHMTLYGQKEEKKEKVVLRGNYVYHLCQLLMNGFLLISAITTIGFSKIFPFLSQNHQTQMIVLAWLLVGMFLASVCLYRIHKIRKNKDKYYGYIQEFEKTML